MTEIICPQGHTVNPGEAVCVRCGSAATSPIVPPGEASEEQIAAATGASQTADNESTTDGAGDEVKTDEASSDAAADTTGTEAGSETSTDTETKPEGEQPAGLAGEMEAEKAKE